MHDIDRAMFELESLETAGELGQQLFEAQEAGYEVGLETQEYELAAELLEITTEAELEQFLGKLLSSAGSAVRGFVNSSAGRAVGGILKAAARTALPQVGQVLGDAVSPGLGGVGAQAGRWLGDQFELEGLSAEDREFETARAFVRFAQDAARQAAHAAPTAPPAVVAQQAAVSAAQRHAPALAPLIQGAQLAGTAKKRDTQRTTGRWVRRGNTVVLLGM